MASVRILFLTSLCLVIIGQFDFIKSSPLSGKRRVVYSRYVRRRPIPCSNNCFDEVIEVFNTHRKPPPAAFLNDEDLTRFVRCNYDPSMPDCDETTTSLAPKTSPAPVRTSTSRMQLEFFSAPSTTTKSSLWGWGRTSEITTTTKTTENIEDLTSSATISPKTSGENEGANSPDTDDDNYDNSEDAIESSDFEADADNDADADDNADADGNADVDDEAAVDDDVADDADDADADGEVEAQTQETTTKKSFLWF